MPGKKSYGGKSLTKTMKKEVKELIQAAPEKKYFDTSLSITNITYSGNISSVSDIPQGVTDITRVGDKCSPTSLEITYVWQGAKKTAPFGYDLCRLIIFRWRMDDADDAPNAAEILQQAGNGFAPYGPYNHDLREKFTIIYDSLNLVSEILDVGGVNQLTAGNEHLVRKKRFKLAHKPIHFEAAGTTGFNKIYVMGISDEQTAGPQLAYYTRLNYTDS